MAFETVGIDFAGPLFIKEMDRTESKEYAYICLITWTTTRATYLALVQSLARDGRLPPRLLKIHRFSIIRHRPPLSNYLQWQYDDFQETRHRFYLALGETGISRSTSLLRQHRYRVEIYMLARSLVRRLLRINDRFSEDAVEEDSRKGSPRSRRDEDNTLGYKSSSQLTAAHMWLQRAAGTGANHAFLFYHRKKRTKLLFQLSISNGETFFKLWNEGGRIGRLKKSWKTGFNITINMGQLGISDVVHRSFIFEWWI